MLQSIANTYGGVVRIYGGIVRMSMMMEVLEMWNGECWERDAIWIDKNQN